MFVLATLAALPGTPFMVAQRSLLPGLARRPEELSAANGVASTITAPAFFAGPALAAALLGVASVEIVLPANVTTFLWSMAFPARLSAPGRPPEAVQRVSSHRAEISAGFHTIVGDRRPVLIATATCAQTVVSGASTVFVLVMADSLMGTGPRGFGYLQTALGLGALAGGMVAISRSSRGRLSSDLIVGVALWSLPLAMVTAWPTPFSCVVAMIMLGLGNAFVDVNLDTIVQRVVPDELLGRVFGTLEACFIVTMAMGALAMPFLIEWLGLRAALLAPAMPVALIAGSLLPSMRRPDSTLVAPANLHLLEAIDIFAPLPLGAVETLARAAESLRFGAGETIVREGDAASLFFIIESGRVQVTQGLRALRAEGPGEFFGEIGLLRDVPRTATITAPEDTVVRVIDRDDFLRAVTGHSGARLAADNVATRRLAV
ncbi:cyclic nucleotide-binding domain-containing protein [Nocardioides sp. B-3]|uniref:cyclic nucleotide-binding domain-containing protein n=1 Tax=Nocardioides sp. B-3 TaxID=2895565 RepID=UPI002152119E|nr:cyclic nucleotide-binding domain-containing protein [Nocardioides sp. B-3]UUZ58015.1 cyclic nucleotide-binding domain-containing protein [Nocardioides sp. B-3]